MVPPWSPKPQIPSCALNNNPPSGAEVSSSRPSRYRFTLGMLMAVITLLGVWGAWRTNRARDQRRVARAVERLDGFVHYDWQPNSEEEERRQALRLEARLTGQPQPTFLDGPWGPEWLQHRLGVEYFQHIVRIGLRGDPDQNLSSDELDSLCRLPQMESLFLRGIQLTDSCVRSLSKHRRLRSLTVIQCGLTDDHCAKLSSLSSLTKLSIDSSQVTDRGLRYLARLNLKELTLMRAEATDGSVPLLVAGFPQLERLHLRETQISVPGYSRLKREMTDVDLRYEPSMNARQTLPKHLQQIVIPTGSPLPGRSQ